MARPRYHHGNLRQVVLDATLAIAAEEGVARLSLREIARRAGVSHTAPYHHFADVAAVYAAIAEQSFAMLIARMQAAVDAVDAADPRERARARFEASGTAYARFAADNPGRFRIMFRPDLRGQRYPAVDAEAARAHDVLAGLVAEAQAAGLAADKDHEALVLTGWAAAHGLAALLVDGPLGRDADAGAGAGALAVVVARTLGGLLG